MINEHFKDCVQQSQNSSGQQTSTEGQRALIEAYKAISDLLPETPAAAWNAWVRLGKRAEKKLSYLKKNWLWNC